jgi:hypothetical protein
MRTLRDRIRERAYHLWSNGCGLGDDNHYWLMAEREVLAEIAAESLLASASTETAQPVLSVLAKTAAPHKARATTKSSPKVASKAAAPTSAAKSASPTFAKSAVVTPMDSESETQAEPMLAASTRTSARARGR